MPPESQGLTKQNLAQTQLGSIFTPLKTGLAAASLVFS